MHVHSVLPDELGCCKLQRFRDGPNEQRDENSHLKHPAKNQTHRILAARAKRSYVVQRPALDLEPGGAVEGSGKMRLLHGDPVAGNLIDGLHTALQQQTASG